MNGVHDLGGMQGFGPVERERDEPVFHAPWEAVVFAIRRSRSVIRHFTIDEFRHTIERMDPAGYLGSTYYERWLDALVRVLAAKGVVALEEVEARATALAERVAAAERATLSPGHAALPAGSPGRPAAGASRRYGGAPEPPVGEGPVVFVPPSSVRPATRAARFAPGDRVVTRNAHPTGHTRLPRYARGKLGVIDRLHGTHVFPDANAHGRGEQPQPLYSVRFEAVELWGESAEPNQRVFLDLWESYLEPADGRRGGAAAGV
jgi:nitrile hydratase subunit beta